MNVVMMGAICTETLSIYCVILIMRIRLSGCRHATIIIAHAPTMTYPDEEKEKFYVFALQKFANI